MKKSKIKSVKFIGKDMTYNVEMKSSQHNYFIENNRKSAISLNSHSVVYSLLSLQTAFLKTHYPVEFMCNLLSSEIGDDDKLPLYIAEAKRMGIHILPPHFNKSKKEYTVESVIDKRTGQTIEVLRTPLNFVKGVGDKALDAIVNSQPFNGLMDFLSRVDLRAVNSKVFNALVDEGALNGIEGEIKGEDIKQRYEECKILIEKKKKVAKKEEENKKQWGGSLFDVPLDFEIKL